MPRGTDENGIKWLPRKNTPQLYKCTSKNTNENKIKGENEVVINFILIYKIFKK